MVRLIVFERREAGGQRALVAERSQPQIDLEQPSLRRRRRQRTEQTLGEARIIKAERQRFRPVRLCLGGPVVVYEDKIEVGGCREFSAAQLAQRHNAKPAFGEASVFLGKRRFDAGQDGRYRGIGDIGVDGAGLCGRYRAAQEAHADAEARLGAPAAHGIQALLEAAVHRKGRRKLVGQCLPVRHTVKKTAVEQRIEQGRPPPPAFPPGRAPCP